MPFTIHNWKKQTTYLFAFQIHHLHQGMICQSKKFGCLLQKKEIRLSGGRCTLVCWWLLGCLPGGGKGQRLGLREINVSSMNKTPEEARNTPSFAKHLQEWSIGVVKRIGKGHICRDWAKKHGGGNRSNIFAIPRQFHVELPELIHMPWLKRESVRGSVWWDGQLPQNINRLHVSALGWSSQPGCVIKKWKNLKNPTAEFPTTKKLSQMEKLSGTPLFFGEVWGGYIFSAETLKPSSLPIFQPCILCGFCHFVLVHPALVELCKWDPADLVTWKNPPRKMARSNCKIYTPRKLTWIPKIAIVERRYILKPIIFGIY